MAICRSNRSRTIQESVVNLRLLSALLGFVAINAAPVFAQSAPGDDGVEVVRKPVSEIPAQYRSDAAKPRKPFAVRYTCPESGRLYVIFDHAQQIATIEMGQTTRYLKQGVSASGARYVNSDESYVFWVKGQQATINGKEQCEAD
jgi:membrane-bound inhibitor of C-type lysozyme